MKTSNEMMEEFKRIWKADYNEDLDDATAFESANNLLNFFELLLKIQWRLDAWNERLKTSPEGFALPVSSGGSYTCCVCSTSVSGTEGWYDQHGIKCLACQEALRTGVIPPEVCTDRKSWHSMSDLKQKFGWHHSTVIKKIRMGELDAFIIKDNGMHVFSKSQSSFQQPPG